MIAVMLLGTGCSKYVVNQNIKNDNKPTQENINTSKGIVSITDYYSEPESMSDKNTLVLDGLSEGEFLEFIVEGEIQSFQHIKLEWDSNRNELVEKDVINSIEKLENQTMVIKTYMPEGIPSEKLKWKSVSGKNYEFIIQQDGKTATGVWEFIIE